MSETKPGGKSEREEILETLREVGGAYREMGKEIARAARGLLRKGPIEQEASEPRASGPSPEKSEKEEIMETIREVGGAYREMGREIKEALLGKLSERRAQAEGKAPGARGQETETQKSSGPGEPKP